MATSCSLIDLSQVLVFENNQGAALLRLGEYDSAFAHLMLALEGMSGWVAQGIHEPPNDDPRNHREPRVANTTGCPAPCFTLAGLGFREDNARSDRAQASATSSSARVWSDPFTLIETLTSPALQSEMQIAASACAIFNMALLHQSQAMRQKGDDAALSSPGRASYSRAIQLYHQSLLLLDEVQGTNDTQCISQWLVFELAILNNMGHCYAELLMYEQSKVCFDKLLCTTMMILHGHECLRAQTTMGSAAEVDLMIVAKFFLRNTSDVGAAPAA
eukprot:CAMPEP_0176002794 /NCGR_PEP_ID=MMETSP0120_2-20121206/834_1 /TAXON_ID=160619 /ORGANISM="Kryptoperidinium foliaceum, Strain CCMP 1326" /LENGTH=273 /DNA_ID=CAMNT_0017335401 /DNA_START=436 /DNA_END=1257 /DNA_ORIENTATION=+